MRPSRATVVAAGLFVAACGARSSLDVSLGAGGTAPEHDAGPIGAIGCSDGSREAFKDRSRYPLIAGCAGAFRLPGVNPPPPASCNHGGGNDSDNSAGIGCAASDLCADGWHVCTSAAEVAADSIDGCHGSLDADPDSFFTTQQSGPGCDFCSNGTEPDCDGATCHAGCAQTTATANDLFGCGTTGGPPGASCAPLDRTSNNLCLALPHAWLCPDIPGGDTHESQNVTKLSASGGGVLCCAD